MLLNLPSELLVMALQNLPAHDLARVERTCKFLERVSKDYGWSAASYGTDQVVHDPIAPTTSPGLRALCLQRTQRTSLIRNQFPQRPPVERALDLFNLGRYADVIVSLQCDNQVDPDMYLHTMKRALIAQGRAAQAEHFAGFQDAIKRDDEAAVTESMRHHGVRMTLQLAALATTSKTPRVREAVIWEIASRRSPWRHQLVQHAAKQRDVDLVARLLELKFPAPANLMHFAVDQQNLSLVERLLGLGFRASIDDAAGEISSRRTEIFDLLQKRQGFSPAELDRAVGFVLDTSNMPRTAELLHKLRAQGAPFAGYHRAGIPTALPLIRGGVQTTPDVLKTLCGFGVDPHATDAQGANAWHWLVQSNVTDLNGVAEFLHSKGVNIRAKAGPPQLTPLALTCITNRASDVKSNVLQTLVRFGAPLHGAQALVEGGPVTALHFVTKNFHEPWARTLLSLGVPLDPSHLSFVLRRGHYDLLSFFLNAHPWPQERRDQALTEAMALPHTPTMRARTLRLLVNHGANINGLRPLRVATSGARKTRLDPMPIC